MMAVAVGGGRLQRLFRSPFDSFFSAFFFAIFFFVCLKGVVVHGTEHLFRCRSAVLVALLVEGEY